MALAPVSGAVARLLLYWLAGRFSVAISDTILIELRRTLANPWFRRQTSSDDVRAFLAFVQRHAVFYPVTTVISGVATHPEDGLVLAAAVSVGAAYLVTGDRRFRARVLGFQGVQLVSPTEFVAILEAAPNE